MFYRTAILRKVRGALEATFNGVYAVVTALPLPTATKTMLQNSLIPMLSKGRKRTGGAIPTRTSPRKRVCSTTAAAAAVVYREVEQQQQQPQQEEEEEKEKEKEKEKT